MISRRNAALGTFTLAGYWLGARQTAHAASASHLITESNAALTRLYTSQPKTKALADKAKAILVFPDIVKAGFVVGAQTGNGAFFKARASNHIL